VERNKAVINRTVTALLQILSEPKMADQVCLELFEALDVPVSDDGSYFLLRPTVSAYLSHLQRVGQVATEVSGKSVVWRRT